MRHVILPHITRDDISLPYFFSFDAATSRPRLCRLGEILVGLGESLANNKILNGAT